MTSKKSTVVIFLIVTITYLILNNLETVTNLGKKLYKESTTPDSVYNTTQRTDSDQQINSTNTIPCINAVIPTGNNNTTNTLENIYPDIDTFIPVENQPQPIIQPPPIYPHLAQLTGLEGTVYVKILVGEDGTPIRAVIHKSDAEVFNESAIEAAMNSSFTPAILNNEPVACWVIIPYRFQLKN
jgi:TonB family protein